MHKAEPQAAQALTHTVPANQSAQRQSDAQSGAFLDMRPVAQAQRGLQALVDNSPQVRQRQAMAGLMNRPSPNSVQRLANEEVAPDVVAPMKSAEATEPVQAKSDDAGAAQLQEKAEAKPNNTGLPGQLKSGIESLSGMSMDHVKVHYNSAKPAQLQAHAYAQGSEIHVAPGQERHLAHEAWHVVQQAQGRVQPTMQMKGGTAVNDDAGLEHEADVMGAKASGVKEPVQPMSKQVGTSTVTQRVLEINGKQYKSMKELSSDGDAFNVYMKNKSVDKKKFLEDLKKVYRITTEGEIVESDGKIDIKVDPYDEKFKTAIRSAHPLNRVENYPIGEALYAPIGHAIVVKGQGQYKYIGTDGLTGCVEVMMECKSSGGNVYLVAHVSSHIAKDTGEIGLQLGRMLEAVNSYMEEEVGWADFGLKPNATGKLTLVRSSGGVGDQMLYQNMIRQLVDLGACMKETVSNSLTMDISVPEAVYYDNDIIKPKPKNVDQRGEDGYPFPEDKTDESD